MHHWKIHGKKSLVGLSIYQSQLNFLNNTFLKTIRCKLQKLIKPYFSSVTTPRTKKSLMNDLNQRISTFLTFKVPLLSTKNKIKFSKSNLPPPFLPNKIF